MPDDPVDILGRTAWGEARDQGREGMLAVAAVVMNRVRLGGWWGTTVLEVCLHAVDGIHQFSCWNEDDPNCAKALAVTDANPQFVVAMSVANEVMSDNYTDPTGGADSYFAEGTPTPPWAVDLSPTAIIGAHRFYRTRPAMPGAQGTTA